MKDELIKETDSEEHVSEVDQNMLEIIPLHGVPCSTTKCINEKWLRNFQKSIAEGLHQFIMDPKGMMTYGLEDMLSNGKIPASIPEDIDIDELINFFANKAEDTEFGFVDEEKVKVENAGNKTK